MLYPYRMVVANILSSFILIIGLLFYKFIFPKRKIDLFFLLILISILPIISIFRNGGYESGDFNIHIYRTMAFYDSLKEGNIMPSWAKDLNATYGYPLFIFNYSFPYYVLSLIHFFGFSFINSMKIFLGLSFILSGILMYLWTKYLFRSSLAAFTASVFYLFAPYHLIDLHFKVAIGEVLFFALLPLSFLLLHKLHNKKTLFLTLIAALSFATLMMSHVMIAIFTGILMLFYSLFCSLKENSRTILLYTIKALSMSLFISLYAWFGPFLLSKYSFIEKIPLGTVYFPTFQDIFYSPWRMGLLFQGPKGEISHLLGYTHIFIIISTLIFLYIKKSPKKINYEVLFWFTSSLIIIFLILPYSKSLWEFLPIIKVAGSHRLLILASFTTSILAGYFVLAFKKKRLVYFLIAISIGLTILNWGHRRLVPEIDDEALRRNLWKSTSEGEAHFYANTKWADIKNPWFSKLPKRHLEIISGEGEAKDVLRTSTHHKYALTAKSPLVIQENTLYFPGWEASINGKILPIFPNEKGLISFQLPKGTYGIELIYNDVLIYKILKISSFAGFSLALAYVISYLLGKKPYAKK